MCGVAANAGTTHLCIAIANFLCGKFCSDTAYLEMNGSHQIHALAGRGDPKTRFVHQRIAYYPDMTLARSQEPSARGYRYLVLDFGSLNPHTLQDFMRCDIRLVVGYTSPWKIAQYRKAVQRLNTNIKRKENLLYLSNYIENPCSLEQRSKELGVPLVPVPFLPDPFHITSDHFAFFEQILGGR